MQSCRIRSDGSTHLRCWVDCLTKDMKTNYLRDTLKSGIYSIVPTAESEVTKLAKQKYRRMKSQSLEQAEEVEEDVEND